MSAVPGEEAPSSGISRRALLGAGAAGAAALGTERIHTPDSKAKGFVEVELP